MIISEARTDVERYSREALGATREEPGSRQRREEENQSSFLKSLSRPPATSLSLLHHYTLFFLRAYIPYYSSQPESHAFSSS